MRDFDTCLADFRDSISSYEYYIDFPKVVANAEAKRHELHLLNALIGRKNIKEEFCNLVTKFSGVITIV